MQRTRSEDRDGMQIEWDVPIPMDDGIVLRADIFRPTGEGRLSRHFELRPLRKGAVVSGGLQGQLGAIDQGGARSSARLQQ